MSKASSCLRASQSLRRFFEGRSSIQSRQSLVRGSRGLSPADEAAHSVDHAGSQACIGAAWRNRILRPRASTCEGPASGTSMSALNRRVQFGLCVAEPVNLRLRCGVSRRFMTLPGYSESASAICVSARVASVADIARGRMGWLAEIPEALGELLQCAILPTKGSGFVEPSTRPFFSCSHPQREA